MIRLSAYLEKESGVGKIIYNPKEKGFDTLPDVKSDIALLVAYVNIGFDSQTMCANQVFGLSPSFSWIKKELSIPGNALPCALKLDEDFDCGTWRLDRGNEWKTYYDAESGWVCIGNPEFAGRSTNINFMDAAMAILGVQGELQALWIKPLIADDISLTF